MKLKVVFFGTPDFALPALQACSLKSDLSLCISQPNKARGRGQEILPSPVTSWAQNNHIQVLNPASLKESYPDSIKLKEIFNSLKPDLFVVVAYGRIIPLWLLDFPRLGCVNVHASLLPCWRGASPIQRSIEAGDSVSGVSLQKMVFELDAGDVLFEKTTPISPNENAAELSSRLSLLGGELVSELFDYVSNHNSLPPGKTQDPKKITHARKIEKSEGLWSPEWGSTETHNRVRAFYSWPQVLLKLPQPIGDLKILECTPSGPDLPNNLKHPVLFEKGGSFFVSSKVRAGEAASFELIQVKPDSKKAMSAKAFFSNFKSQMPIKPLTEAL